MKLDLHLVFAAALLIAMAGHAAPPKKDHQQMEQNTRLQIFLDNANFGPGKIDGQQGEFTKKALALYRQAKDLPGGAPANSKSKAPADTTGVDLSSIEPVFTTYTVTAEDVANVGELPSGPAAQAKVKRLPYATVAEGVAEKFHCDLKFFKELNHGKAEKLKAGDQVTVPNVKPFEIGEVKSLQPGSEAKAVIANELGEDKDSGPTKTEASKEGDTAKLSLHVGVKDEMLTVLADDKIVAAFPVTVGSQQTASPIGKWTVKAVAKFPNFRYDPLMLQKGERGSSFHLLPPGPNNPVGVIWIALNKKGIGIHGTNDPDSIGRNASHGCIRLANWDIVKLAEMVKAGVTVTVDDASVTPPAPAAAAAKP